MIDPILIVAGAVCIFLAAFNVSSPRVSLFPLGVGLVVLTLLV